MRKPLISIITVCFNSEEFIEQCVQSVLSQDFDDYEYIIIDGGSSDRTVEIIQNYQGNLAYWHSKPDRGISHAFNQGLEHASGEWIVFLNSDDYFVSKGVLAKFGELLPKLINKDLVFGQIRYIERQREEVFLSKIIGKEFKWADFIKNDTIPHPACFMHHTYFDTYGIFDEKYLIAMDYELLLRAGKMIRTCFLPGLVTNMREGGLSRSMQLECYKEWKIAHKKNKKVPFIYIYIYYYIHRARIFLKSLC